MSPKKSSLVRRQQRQRSDARFLTRLLTGLTSISAHRGNRLSTIGKTFLENLVHDDPLKIDMRFPHAEEPPEVAEMDIGKDDTEKEGEGEHEDDDDDEATESEPDDENLQHLRALRFNTTAHLLSPVSFENYVARRSGPIYFSDTPIISLNRLSEFFVPEIAIVPDAHALALLREAHANGDYFFGRVVLEIDSSEWFTFMQLLPDPGALQHFFDMGLVRPVPPKAKSAAIL